MSDSNLKELPGPTGIPIFGSMFSLGEYRERVLDSWAKEYYGPVYQVPIGSRVLLVIQGYDANYEAMVEKAEVFSGRIEAPVLDDMRKKNGLFFVQYGEHWKKWRAFSANALVDINKPINRAICQEAKHLVRFMDGQVGKKFSIADYITNTMANVVMQTCYSRRFEIDDKAFSHLVNQVYETSYSKKFGLLLFMPWLGSLPPFSGFLSDVKHRRKWILKELTKMVKERRSENRQHPDLVSCFYDENANPSAEDIVSLTTLFQDMIYAGSLTTGSECLWGLLYLLRDPDKMAKLQREVDSFAAEHDEPLEAAMKPNEEELNYLKAVVEEAKRIRPIAPTSLFRETTEDTSLSGYRVPKGMPVMSNLWSIQHDPQNFPNPEEFRPERFITPEGRFVPSKFVVPFGMGWRNCVAYHMANVEMREFLLALVLNYNVELLTPLSDDDMMGRFIGILAPPEFKVKLTKRN